MFALKSQSFLRPDRVKPVYANQASDPFTEATDPFHPKHRSSLRAIIGSARFNRTESRFSGKVAELEKAYRVVDKLAERSGSISTYGARAAFDSLKWALDYMWTPHEVRMRATLPICKAAINPKHFMHEEAWKVLEQLSKNPSLEIRTRVVKTCMYTHLNQTLPESLRHRALRVVSDRFAADTEVSIPASILRAYARLALLENPDKLHMANHFLGLCEDSSVGVKHPKLADDYIFLKLRLEQFHSGGNAQVMAGIAALRSLDSSAAI